uniref:Uncharacterized protein n=1 Tax=Monopterus albus TaxID=43700 RepID=A0A3Q3IAN7_MONAL
MIDPHFRMVFLFQEVASSNFIREFSMRQPRMLQFLKELEEAAVQLDRMRKGAKISSVAGSSVGAVGGVLSIIGLALIPVTAGLSLALTVTGIGMGITSGVNSIVTTATSQPITDVEISEINVAEEAVKVFKESCAVQQLMTALVIASVVAQEANVLRNVPRVASDIPDIGQSARAGFITLNALFIGMDIFFICKDSISLAKGSETEVSQFIRARAILDLPCYLMMEKKKQIEAETEMEIPSDEVSNKT